MNRLHRRQQKGITAIKAGAIIDPEAQKVNLIVPEIKNERIR